MQLYLGLRMLDAPFENGRQINLYLFMGQRHLLVDSGVARVPTETVLPALAQMGLAAGDIDLLVNLHAHADHIGGGCRTAGGLGWTAAHRRACAGRALCRRPPRYGP
jgi:glyoxylase-like metal-dependent hydrolase (beta-lactamase superfamily II)